MIDFYNRLQALAATVGTMLQTPFLLLIRLYWGWQLMQTGWGKLQTLDKVTQFFTSLGIPAPGANAVVVACLEFGGGILLMLGLGSRLIAIPLIVSMFVAFVTADREALMSIFSDPDKFYAAAPYTFLFALLLIFIFGPGRLSVDELMRSRSKVEEPSVAAGKIARPASQV